MLFRSLSTRKYNRLDSKKCSAIARMGIAKYLFFIIGQFFLLSVFLRGLLQYNRFNLKSLLRGEAVIFRKRYRKGTRFIFLAEPFDLSLKDVFLIVGDMLNLALGSLRSAKLLELKQKIPTAKAAVGMIKSDCTS